MTVTGRKIQEIDKAIGRRLEQIRRENGLTQQELAALMGVTYQQAHKYERGINRLSAGRLAILAEALGIPPAHFFLHLVRDTHTEPYQEDSQALEAKHLFQRIHNPQQREALLRLMQAMTRL